MSDSHQQFLRVLVQIGGSPHPVAVGHVRLLWVGFRQSQNGHERKFSTVIILP